MGYTTRALDMALRLVEYACVTFGVPLTAHATEVSDENPGSMKVLLKNTYVLTTTNNKSPIRMGGSNMLAQKYPSNFLNPNKYSIW
ncbi:MAG: hypothetical protein Q8L51_02130 [Candidatus Amesbacteria bacterium]|nr:hypothetical protein [Candidatus Amesbacteria bacterium]